MSELMTLVNHEAIQNKIFTIRGKQVMLDRDLAELYGVETKRLNEQVFRNIERFPESVFMFQMSEEELKNWKSQFATSNREILGLRKRPYVFTEFGVVMLSAILRSKTAVSVSLQITSAFVNMRKFLRENAEVFTRLDHVERSQIIFRHETDQKFAQIFDALQNKQLASKQGIFYDGQIFDAYIFLSDLIKQAKSSIILIDNYVDETVLNLFVKRKKGIPLLIYTKEISNQFKLDLIKYNKQYAPATAKKFNKAHDRFLILDNTIVYHFGASLKDLGYKWFAFSKMELNASDIINRLK